MEIWALIYYITALALIIIPTIFCCTKFSKAKGGTCISGACFFLMMNFLPSPFGIGGANAKLINSFLEIMILLWILGIGIGIGIAFLNWKILKQKNPKITHNDTAFSHSVGMTSLYSFLYFVMYGTLIYFFEDDEDFRYFEIAYRKHAWKYYIIELIYFTGFFFSTSVVFFILKYDLNKVILIFLMIAQSSLYAINNIIIFDFRNLFILILVITSIFEIGYGYYIWKKYYSDENSLLPEIENNMKTELINNAEVNNQV